MVSSLSYAVAFVHRRPAYLRAGGENVALLALARARAIAVAKASDPSRC